MVGVPKKEKKISKHLLGLYFVNDIYMEQICEKKWIVQNKIIHVVVMIFHIHTLLCTNILVYKQNCKKC